MRASGEPQQPSLWTGRYLMDGQIQIARSPTSSTWHPAALALANYGRAWRRNMSVTATLAAAIPIAVATQIGLRAGVLVLAMLGLMLGLLVLPSMVLDADRWYASVYGPEVELATANSPEARVAGAACRAWRETLTEPSWSSPQLAVTRASFDGRGEVDAIIDVALRIHAARKALGAQPPPGPARDYWQQQSESLNRSAERLGERTDALIRHRDQAAALSAALVQLAELGRLELVAMWVDEVASETHARAVEPDVLSVADQIEATRQAVNELVEMMVRTRAPLMNQPPPSLP